MTEYKRTFRFTVDDQYKNIVEEMLTLQGYSWIEQSPFSENKDFTLCRLLEEPKPLGSSLASFFGLIYIQDSSSMLPPWALNPPKGAIVLDVCSSPGSKTSQLAKIVGENGFVLGNEISTSRLTTLRKNLQQLNLIQSGTCCHEGQKIPLPDNFFDFIQLDPPCSGWGTVERNPNVLSIWKDDKIQPLIRLQKDLLNEAVRLLKPNGTMVYSTCTTNVEENEAQVLYAIDQLGLSLQDLPDLPHFSLEKPLLNCGKVWRLSPKIKENQGFFVAKLQKKQTENIDYTPNSTITEQAWGQALPKNLLEEFGLSANILAHGNVCKFNNSLHFIPHLAKILPQNFPWQGMYMGKVSKGNDLQISSRFRLYNDLTQMDFDGQKGLEQIKALLTGQSITCQSVEKYSLMCWNGLPLGRLKIKNKRLLWTER